MGTSNTSGPRPSGGPATVMIVGAGPVGLLLANLLHLWGVSFRIIDEKAGPSTAATALVVPSRTLDMLRELGVGDQAISHGFTLTPCLLTGPQPTLEKILLERLDAAGGRVEWRTELVELQTPPESVHMRLQQGDGRDERVSARWMVACDGAHSPMATAQQVHHGAVFLAGNRAPRVGQLMSLGMGEAYNLAWKIAYVDQGLAAPSLLQSYNQEHAGRPEHRVLVWLRNNILPLLSHWRRIEHRLASMICAHHYRYAQSACIQESLTKKQRTHWPKKGRKLPFQSAAPRAGQLAPDVELWQAPGTPPRHLIDLFHGTFTLLIFSAVDQFSSLLPGYYALADAVQQDYPGIKAYCVIDALSSAEAPLEHSTLLDPDWRLHKRYHARAGTLMLIRPDGYIAFQGPDATTLMTYLHVRSGLLKGVKRTTACATDSAALQL